MLDELLVPLAQLPANASHYAWRLGLPEPDVLQMMTIVWCLCSWIAALASFVLSAAVLSCQKARASAFNLFLVGLTVPDLILNVSSGITLTANLLNPDLAFTGPLGVVRCDWQGELMCRVAHAHLPCPAMKHGPVRCCTHNLHAASGCQPAPSAARSSEHPVSAAHAGFYHTFGVSASFWLNAVVAREVFVLLRKTQRLESYWPPSRRAVLLRCLLVYAWAGFIASWHLWGMLPILSLPLHGLTCVMIDYDVPSTVFFWLAYIPAVSGAPTVYAIVIGYICWRDKLIGRPSPLTGRPSRACNGHTSALVSRTYSRHSLSWSATATGEISASTSAPQSRSNVISSRSLEQRSRQARSLSVYFGRIFLLYFVMWTPAILLIFVTSFRSPWPTWAGGAWAHLSGLVSALIGMSKPDVGQAVSDLLSCGDLLRLRPPPRVSVAGHGAPAMSTITESETPVRAVITDQAVTAEGAKIIFSDALGLEAGGAHCSERSKDQVDCD
jgi:hypothetical protein